MALPFQPAAGVVKVAVVGQVQGETCVNTLHFKHTSSGAPDAAFVSLCAQNVYDHWLNVMLNSLPTIYDLVAVEATGLWAAVAPAALVAAPPGTTGILVNQSSPNNVSLAVKFTSGNRGRSSRGRNFWPAFQEFEVSNNRIDAARISAIVGGYSDMVGKGTFIAAGEWVILSRQQAGVRLANAVAYPVTAVSVTDDIVDSMARRLPKRGS